MEGRQRRLGGECGWSGGGGGGWVWQAGYICGHGWGVMSRARRPRWARRYSKVGTVPEADCRLCGGS